MTRGEQASRAAGAAAAAPDPAPATAEADFQAARAHHRDGRLEEAAALYRDILRRRPGQPAVLHLLGLLEHQRGRRALALKLVGAAAAAKPGSARYLADLGGILFEAGRWAEAGRTLRRALSLQPDHPEAILQMGRVLEQLGETEKAETQFRRAIALRPRSAAAHNALGILLRNRNALEAAAESFGRAIEAAPGEAFAYGNLGMTLWDQGRHEEAEAAFRQALAIAPDMPLAHSNLIYLLTYNCLRPPAEILAECRRWEAQHVPRDKVLRHDPAGADPERRLRIGYVSPDFRRHAVVKFFEPVLEAHDRRAFEICCYAEVARPDAATRRLERQADRWRSTVGLSDDRMVELIRADGIDILVDLAGHTGHNRLTVFGRKPAPVQATWIGYMGTTGLSTMDYILANPLLIPPEQRGHFSETVYDLASYSGFRLPPDIEATEPPCLARGYTTFGCFNNASKLSESALAAWSALLARLPDARLVLKSRAFGDSSTAERFRSRLAALGTDLARVTIEGPSPHRDYLRACQGLDIALDPFPCNGGTTTLDMLCQGVPVVTLRGEAAVSRIGYSTLTSVRLGELVAESPEDYVAKAAALAGDRERLVALRQRLRHGLASLSTDATPVTRAVEAAYRSMWRRWCGHAAG